MAALARSAGVNSPTSQGGGRTRGWRTAFEGRITPLRRTVFYLDDDASQLEVFREMFGDEYDVRTSTSISEALGVLAACAAEIIFSDQRMPGVQGTHFLRAAALACPESVRVLLTGALTVGEVLPDVRSGTVHFFVAKPWTEREMRETLERAGAFLDVRRGPRRRASGE